MLIPAFTLELNNPILRGLAAVGKFDGKHPSLTCATAAGKIFFHSPHEKDGNQVRFLNINRKISAIGCGCLKPGDDKDLLLVGAQTTLLAYDVLENCDLFFKDAPDGVNAIVVGKFHDLTTPMVLVGGNCSIQGFDYTGSEVFWTVTGDNVCTMAFCDVDEDGDLELLVGSDDFEIRVFQKEEVISETTETDRIVALCPMRRHTFGYALGNGTVGVYTSPGNRRWRVKAKHEVTSITGFDLDGDGEPELISGWANGKFEVRSDQTGEVIFKDQLSGPVSQILQADYRSDGRTEVIVCSADGEVRGYLPAGEEMERMAGNPMADKIEDETMRELHQRKQELLFELKQYEEQSRKQKSGDRTAGLAPADTRIEVTLLPSREDKCLYLTLKSVTQGESQALIKAAVVFAERVFEAESFAVHERSPSAELRIPLRPPKDVFAALEIKALAGGRAMHTFHVFELSHSLPKFSMYVPAEQSAPPPVSGVTFALPNALTKAAKWLGGAFSIATPPEAEHRGFDHGFTSLRDGRPLRLRASAEGGGTFSILTDDLELAGEVLQDLCGSLGVSELESIADFADEMEAFRAVLMRVDDFNAARLKLTAEMADQSNTAKMLVIKAEDARILADYAGMRAAYAQLYTLNQELMGEYNKRANNHEQLLGALKEVNHMIQKSARLRVGAPKARIVTACRGAIKANHIQSLFTIMKTGRE